MPSPYREEVSYVFHSVGGIMKCPTCGENTRDAWTVLKAEKGTSGMDRLGYLIAPQADAQTVVVDFMHCENEKCKELVIRIQESFRVRGPIPVQQSSRIWYARPHGSTVVLDPLVQDPYRRDYIEAVAILGLSPRMSSVLSRKILGDLLADFAKLKGYGLAKQIDKFIADSGHPSLIRDNLHHLREIADFSAHTQRNELAEIIDVSPDEARWTLPIIHRLFDYFIIGPEKDRKIRESMDKKIADANRKRIELPSEDDERPEEEHTADGEGA